MPSSSPARRIAPPLAPTLLLLALVLAAPWPAAALTPGNQLLSIDDSGVRQVREYTPAWSLVQSVTVPAHPSGERLRDLVVDDDGVLHLYHGTFAPVLRSWDGSTWSEHTFPGWSTVNNVSYGGIAAFAGYVFVTDMDTVGAPEQGIVRFDTTDGYAAVRFAETHEYRDLTIGLDCRLYALRDPTGFAPDVDVYDPVSLEHLGTRDLDTGGSAPDVRGLAVDADGHLYAAAWNGDLYHFDDADNLVATLDVGTSLSDLNLDTDGDLLATTRLAGAVRTTTALAGFTTFDPGFWNLFGAFVSGERAPECPTCARTVDLAAGEWKMVSLPCDVGTANTLEDVFGDDLDPADFAVTWAAFRRDEVLDDYLWLALSDPLEAGRSYWMITLEPGRTLTVEGEAPAGVDLPLVAEVTDGVQNMVGNPFDFDVCFADVEVVDGASVLSLDQADPLIGSVRACSMVPPDPSCVLSRVAHRWNGAAYAAMDGVTPGMQGTLPAMEGFWVRAHEPGIALRVPAKEGEGCTFCFPQPVADAGADRTICLGDSTTLGTPAQAGHTYGWSPGGAAVAQPTVSPTASTTYTLTASTLCGSAQDFVVVTVDDGTGGFDEDVEGDVSDWTATGLWHASDDSACFAPEPGHQSPTHAFYYGRGAECDYDVGANAGTLTSPPISGVTASTELTFAYLRQAEQSATYDKTTVQVLHPGGTDTVLTLSTNALTWTQAGPVSLAPYAGQTIQVRFSFDSVDGFGNTGSGWMIDDVSVSTASPCPSLPQAPVVPAPGEGEVPVGGGAVSAEWTLRLAVEAGGLRDADSVFGQLEDALDGYDHHDLPEPAPFGDVYLSVVFPHDDWGPHAGDYGSDYRATGRAPGGEWRFDVLAGGVDGPVTLHWAGDGLPRSGLWLVDEDTGERLRVAPFGSHTFDLDGQERRRFRWVYDSP